jgi:hypothetical protein
MSSDFLLMKSENIIPLAGSLQNKQRFCKINFLSRKTDHVADTIFGEISGWQNLIITIRKKNIQG